MGVRPIVEWHASAGGRRSRTQLSRCELEYDVGSHERAFLRRGRRAEGEGGGESARLRTQRLMTSTHHALSVHEPQL